jgi:hypothetical protein
MKRRARALLAAAGVLAVALAVPGASAAATDDAVATPGTVLDDTSSVKAGYVVRRVEEKTIKGVITVPTLDCAAHPDSGVATAMGLYRLSDYAYVGVWSMCEGTVETHRAAVHSAFYGLVPIAKPVASGDRIEVDGYWERGRTKFHVSSLTAGWSVRKVVNGLRPHRAAVLQYAATEDGDPLMIPDFGTVRVSDLLVDGAPLAEARPSRVVLRGDDGRAIIKPSKIKNGTDFTFRYAR